MKTYTTTIPVTPVTGKRGNMYVINGREVNGGGCCEVLLKDVFGLPAVKDNTSWRESCDIPELGLSVKSHLCTLADDLVGDDIEPLMDAYLAGCHCTYTAWVEWQYSTSGVQTLKVWFIPNAKLKEFFLKFGRIDGGKVRIKEKTWKRKQSRTDWLDRNAYMVPKGL